MIDWQKVTLNIRAESGLSLHTIARQLGLSHQHLTRLARGEVVEPRFNTGIKLLDMHYDLMGDRHKEALMAHKKY